LASLFALNEKPWLQQIKRAVLKFESITDVQESTPGNTARTDADSDANPDVHCSNCDKRIAKRRSPILTAAGMLHARTPTMHCGVAARKAFNPARSFFLPSSSGFDFNCNTLPSKRREQQGQCHATDMSLLPALSWHIDKYHQNAKQLYIISRAIEEFRRATPTRVPPSFGIHQELQTGLASSVDGTIKQFANALNPSIEEWIPPALSWNRTNRM
jgi:hypothetical protein